MVGWCPTDSHVSTLAAVIAEQANLWCEGGANIHGARLRFACIRLVTLTATGAAENPLMAHE